MEEESKTESTSPLRTYQSDVHDLLKNEQGSLAKIAIAEQSYRLKNPDKVFREETDPVNAESLSRKILFAGIIVFFLAGLGVAYFLLHTNEKDIGALNLPPVRSLIVTDNTHLINITQLNRTSFLEAFHTEKKQQFSLGAITGLRFIDGLGSTGHVALPNVVFKKLDIKLPDMLERSLSPDMLFGIHTVTTNHLFLILKTSYYQNAFAGMLSWENTMERDLGDLFNETPFEKVETTTATLLKPQRKFVDAVIKNRDVRVLKNEDGNMILLYSFPDKNTIIITTNENTLLEVASKLLLGKQVQ